MVILIQPNSMSYSEVELWPYSGQDNKITKKNYLQIITLHSKKPPRGILEDYRLLRRLCVSLLHSWLLRHLQDIEDVTAKF